MSRQNRHSWRLGAIVALMLGAAWAADIKTGPAVGAAVPAFTARDQNGREQTLQSLTGPKGTLLVFYRSADW